MENSFLSIFGQKGPKYRVFCFFLILLFIFPKNNAKGKFFRFLTFHRKPHVWQNSFSGGFARNVLDQSDRRIL